MSNETALLTELTKYDPDTIIELFVLDLTPIADYYGIATNDQYYYFYNGTNPRTDGGSTNLVWQGITYSKTPVFLDNYIISSSGELPKPTLEIADNYNPRVILPLLIAYDDLIRCKVIRKRTLLKFIDAVNFNGGTSPYTPDPDAHFPDEVFSIDRKASETKEKVTFELSVPWDVENILIPNRLVMANLCPWEYRGGVGKTYVAKSTNIDAANYDSTWTNVAMQNLERIHSVAANGATVVAVGMRGTVIRSTNSGTTWNVVTQFTNEIFWGISYALSLFIAVGSNGTIYTSTDGSSGSWTLRTSGTTKNLRAVSVQSTTTVVAVGDDNTVISSTNGTAWTARTSNLPASTDLIAVAYNVNNNSNSRFVVIGRGGKITTAGEGGATWTVRTSNTNVDLTAIAVNGARTVITGKRVILTTDDGVTFTYRGMLRNAGLFTHISYTTANVFVGVGYNGIIGKSINPDGTASNGEAWEIVEKDYKSTYLTSLYISGTVFAIGGEDIIISDAPSGCTYDGSKYFDANDSPTTAANDVCGKRYTSCIKRFGNKKPNSFGGFLSAGLLQ